MLVLTQKNNDVSPLFGLGLITAISLLILYNMQLNEINIELWVMIHTLFIFGYMFLFSQHSTTEISMMLYI